MKVLENYDILEVTTNLELLELKINIDNYLESDEVTESELYLIYLHYLVGLNIFKISKQLKLNYDTVITAIEKIDRNINEYLINSDKYITKVRKFKTHTALNINSNNEVTLNILEGNLNPLSSNNLNFINIKEKEQDKERPLILDYQELVQLENRSTTHNNNNPTINCGSDYLIDTLNFKMNGRAL